MLFRSGDAIDSGANLFVMVANGEGQENGEETGGEKTKGVAGGMCGRSNVQRMMEEIVVFKMAWHDRSISSPIVA